MNTEPIFRIMRYAKAGKLNDALKTCRTREWFRHEFEGRRLIHEG